MKHRHLIEGLMAIALAYGAPFAMADDFELAIKDIYEIYDGVGFMKPEQSIVYTREFLYEDANCDWHYSYTFYDKDFKVCATLADINSENILKCDEVLNHNNLITGVKHYALFTQTFFNDDDDIEYVEITKSATKTTLNVKQVFSGKTIATHDFDFPENTVGISVNPYTYLDMAGNHYIEFSVNYDTGNYDTGNDVWQGSMQIYRVNGDGNGAGTFALVAESKAKAYPNPVNQGEVFNIQLQASDDGVVTIFDVNGRYIKAVEIIDGKASIDTNDMPKGMYVYNAQSKGKTLTKNKLIVK